MSRRFTMALTVKELAGRPFIQHALQSPMKLDSVLSFIFGVDTTSSEGRQSLKQGTCMDGIMPLWFGSGGDEYDQLCQPFADAVRASGKRLVPSWNDSVDGLMAQVVLTDQLSRNIFRGTDEAFAYEDVSLDCSRQLAELVFHSTAESKNLKNCIKGEIYPSYMLVIGLALMHSESIGDHEKCLELIEHAKETSPDCLQHWWNAELEVELDHKKVIDRFGRYPHRNKFKERECTEDERIWLADTENLPAWAKSQG